MKKTLIVLLFLLTAFTKNIIAQSTANVTFQVDMNNLDPTTFTTPEVNGSFNNWCGNCWAMSDADGDNVWDIVGTIDVNTDYEFKFSADGWGIQETLLQGSPLTFNSLFVNPKFVIVQGEP